MQTLVERGCGLDVHQATVVACLLIVLKDGKVHRRMRTFGTTTRELVGLREWLLSEGCTHVAMESTGVYWKPVYAILEGALEIVVANAQHVKKVPGRKTDVKDAEWIADLLCHGLLRSSFVPPKPIRELRDLMRYRRKLVESQTAERNRLLKLLETANIKLASVASDVFGVSGRLMLQALAKGKATPQEIAQLAKGLLRKKIPELEPALEGKLEEHHRFLLELQLRRLKAVEEDLALLEQRLQEKLEPYAAQLALLQEIPGVDWTLAAVIIAELGVDMSVFQSVSQAASWAGVCPGNNESAGQTQEQPHSQGQYLSEDSPGGGRPVGFESERNLPEGQILPSQGPAWIQAGSRGGGSQDLVGDLSHAFPGSLLSGSWRPLPRQAQQTSPESKLGSSLGAFRLYGDTGAAGRVTERVLRWARLPAEPVFMTERSYCGPRRQL
jgi:transposase